MTIRTSRKKIIRAAAALLGALAIMLTVAILSGRFSGIEGEARRIRAQGLPASVEDLEAWVPHDGAVEKIGNALVALVDEVEHQAPDGVSVSRFDPNDWYSERSYALMNGVPDQCDRLLDRASTLLHTGVASLASQPSPPFAEPKMYYPALAVLREAFDTSGTRFAKAGNYDKACERLADLLWIEKALGGIHLDNLPSRLVCTYKIESVLGAILCGHKIDRTRLESIRTMIETGYNDPAAFRELVTWRARTLDGMRGHKRGSVFDSFVHMMNERKTLDFAEEFIAASTLPPVERMKQTLEIEWRTDNELAKRVGIDYDFYSEARSRANSIPIVTRGQNAERDTRFILMLAAVDIEIYSLDHGALPASIEEMATSRKIPVPLDPYDGKSVRFQIDPRSSTGYVVYSIGSELANHGGIPVRSDDNFTIRFP